MLRHSRLSLLLVLLLSVVFLGSVGAQTLPSPGTWTAVPNSVLYPVMPPEAKAASAPGQQPELWNPSSAMGAWSGGDVAQLGGVWGFLIWGGGHGDGPDNSLYFIPFDGSGPRALMGPYLAPAGVKYWDQGTVQDAYAGRSRNQPSTVTPGLAVKSRHTYSSILALRDRGLAWNYGGSITSGSGGGTFSTRTFDLGQTYGQAMARPDMGWDFLGNAPGASVTSSSGYDEKRRVVVTRGANFWGVFSPDAKTWTRIGDSWGGSDFSCSVAVDSGGRKMWVLGSRLGEVIDLDTYVVTRFYGPTAEGTQSVRPGYEWVKQVGGSPAPGLAWHPIRKRLLVWRGGQNVLSIDPRANTAATLTMTGAAVTPESQQGTFGRFRLIPGTDTVAVVNAVDQSVFLGTLPGEPRASGPSAPDLPTGGLTAGVIKALALPARGQGIASQSKHVNAAVHPPSGRIFFEGGDYSGLEASGTASYRQETWSLDIAARLASNNPAAGWKLEYPYCGYGGTSVQPKHPDFVGWQWDPARSKFWMVPGQVESTSEVVCPGETASMASDPPNFLYAVMSFDPAKPGPQRWAVETGNFGPNFRETWMSILDPKSDSIYRWGYNGGYGFVIDVLDLKTKTWSTRAAGGKNALGKDIATASKSHLAFDPVARTIYGIDAYSGRLFRFRITTGALDDLGLIPGGPFPTGDGTIYSICSWDSTRQILLVVRNDSLTFLAYHPVAATWEPLRLSTDPPGVAVPFVRTVVYHPTLDAHVMLDVNSAQLFLYRYAGAGVSGRR